MRKESIIIENKNIEVFIHTSIDAPIVFSNDVSCMYEDILQDCKELGCYPFHFVSITNLIWNSDLSPWPSDPIVTKGDNFAGNAEQYLKVLETKILSYVKKLIPGHQSNVLLGYSMAGLFALYVAYKSSCFDAYIAPSSSVWYPNFTSYVMEHSFIRKPKAIYLSLGDKESRTKNPYLSQTKDNMEKLKTHYQKQDISTILELNPGNHFNNVSKRVAKGIDWTLKTLIGFKQ